MRSIIKILFLVALWLLPTTSFSQREDFFKKYNQRQNYHHTLTKNRQTSMQSDSIFTTLGTIAWGPNFTVDVQGKYAYIGNGAVFQVLEISDPSNPKIKGEVLLEDYIIYDIKVKGNYAYVCALDRIHIIDLTSPTKPKIIGVLDIFGEARRIELVDTLALITTLWPSNILCINIQDPSQPIILDSFSLEPNDTDDRSDFTINDYYAYISYNYHYLYIVDFSHPDSLKKVGEIDFSSEGINKLKVRDDILYVTGGGRLRIYNILNPLTPVQIGYLQLGSPNFITLDSRYLYVEDYDSSGILIINDSVPSNPRIVGKVNDMNPYWYCEIVADSGYLFIPSDDLFKIYDVLDLNSITLISNNLIGMGQGPIYLKDSYAFISSSTGLMIYDISNPCIPRRISSIIPNDNISSDLIVEGNYAYLLFEDGNLWIFDVSNPIIPNIISQHQGITKGGWYGHTSSLTKSGNLIFIAQPHSVHNDTTLEIIDITNPFSPFTRGVFHTTYQAWDVEAKDSIVYIATKDGGLRIVNCSNPTEPSEISNLFIKAYCLSIDSNYLYVSSDSIYVLDISQPATPIIVGSLLNNRQYTLMSASKGYLYCSVYYLQDEEGSLDVFNVINPQNPFKRSTFFNYNYYAASVAVKDDIVLFGESCRNIYILQSNIMTYNKPKLDIGEGWNLLSLPTGAMEQKLKNDFFPTSNSSAFTYSTSYVTKDTIENGVGYWLKYDTSQTIIFYGSPLPDATVNIQKGWNMIGSIGTPISTSSVSTFPEGILSSPFYGYNSGYSISDSINPGKGYWVRSSSDGQLYLTSTNLLSKRHPTTDIGKVLTDFNHLVIKYNAGYRQTLYFGEQSNILNEQFFEMPPSTPDQVFDARFVGNSMVALMNDCSNQEFPIVISSLSYPLTIEWELKRNDISASLQIDDKNIPIDGFGSSKIANSKSKITLMIKNNKSIPKEFTLEQNYPNPFNQKTIIRYSLPIDSWVTLKLYNLLGQEIAVLVNEIQLAGNKSILWNGNELSSGMYFYKLNARPLGSSTPDYISVRKLISIK